MEFFAGGTRVTVNVPDMAALERAVAARLAARQGFALATLNLDHLVKLARSERFRAAYAAQDLVSADGNPVVWLSRLAGRPVALVPGSDALRPVLRLAAAQGVPVAFLGSTEASLEAAAARLAAELPGLRIAGCWAPPMGFDPAGAAARALLAEVAASGAGLCVIVLGAPKQEMLAALGRQVAPQIGFACFGAGLDFVAGTQRRAPRWMRRLALEWLWRLGRDPRRLAGRYAACLAILPGLGWRAWRQRQRARG
ncbi:WecB/TagA/CpsF family glycosyltransferase [Roseivivax sp. CAU 1761]